MCVCVCVGVLIRSHDLICLAQSAGALEYTD